MPIQIVRGPQEPDPHCLHCVLPPVITDFVRQHPDYQRGMQTIIDLAMVMGELIGSGLFNSGKREQLDQILTIALAEARRSATELLATMDRKRS